MFLKPPTHKYENEFFAEMSLHSNFLSALPSYQGYFYIEKHLIREEGAALLFIENHIHDASSTGFVMNSFSSININTFICVNRRFEAE